ncbi:Trissin receptor [Frankliniella fusca]|uniref:Trissin receptor n=1 Tax=Frankliniella fusca TaxID=407009 RepID=A0AAE1HCW8_9NEOP|nr:Trissin receptor [Frankliniella fusca]
MSCSNQCARTWRTAARGEAAMYAKFHSISWDRRYSAAACALGALPQDMETWKALWPSTDRQEERDKRGSPPDGKKWATKSSPEGNDNNTVPTSGRTRRAKPGPQLISLERRRGWGAGVMPPPSAGAVVVTAVAATSSSAAGEEYLFDRTDVRAAFIVLYTAVFLVCFFGNLLVIVVASLSRRTRSRTNLFLVNLAVADLSVGVFCVYQNLSIYLVQSWVLGDVVCKLYHFVHNLSYTASIFVLVVVGVERYLAVLHPITCRAILRPSRLRATMACVWLAAAGLSAQRLYWAQTVTVDLPGLFQEIICISNRHKYDQKLWDVVTFVLLYLLPLSAMAILYARIAAVLWGSGRGLGLRQPRARRSAVRLTVTVVGVFALCHLPLHARRLWQHWSPLYRGPSTFSAIFTPSTFLVAYANSAANPILYALLSRNFRSGLRDVLGLIPCRLRGRGRRGSDGSSSGSDGGGGAAAAAGRRRRGPGGGSVLSRTVATAMTELPTLRDHSAAAADPDPDLAEQRLGLVAKDELLVMPLAGRLLQHPVPVAGHPAAAAELGVSLMALNNMALEQDDEEVT